MSLVVKWKIFHFGNTPFGNIQVTMALFETSRQEFETPVTFQLGAISSDEVGRQGTEVNSNSPIGASIKKMSIQLWNHQTNDWSVKVTVWDNGQVNTNNNSYKVKSKDSKKVKVIISETDE